MKKMIAAAAIAALTLTACADDADVASRNLSKAADNFEINRRVVFVNGITDNYLLEMEGFCSIGSGKSSKSITVTCKTGPNEVKKHQVGLSDNVTYVSEQLDAANVSEYHYRVTFKPEQIVPNVDLRTSTEITE